MILHKQKTIQKDEQIFNYDHHYGMGHNEPG
jgi:hypothetical protein